jgi:glycosyltransferase involved in cell wall biosynthesis
MRVIHVTPVYLPAWAYGGTVRAIHGMTTALVAQGHSVEVVTTTIGTPYAASQHKHEATIDGVRVTYVPGFVRWGGGIAPRLPEEVLKRATQDSVVHVSSGWQPAYRGMFAGLRGSARPYAYSPHGCFSPEVFAKGRIKKGLYYRLFERSNLRNAAVVVATSEMEAADLRQLDSSLSVRVLPNVCDANLWRPAEAAGLAWRRGLAIADDDMVILQVCRPDPIKNTSLLVDAVRGIEAGRNYVLVVMGPGQSRLPVERTLPSHVRVIRHDGSSEIPELRAIYTAAQVVAVPSLYECFGNVVLEAILCGTPVLAGPRVGAAYLPDSAAAVTMLPLRVGAWAHAIRAWPRCANVSAETIINTASAVAPSRIANQLGDVYVSIGTMRSERRFRSPSSA